MFMMMLIIMGKVHQKPSSESLISSRLAQTSHYLVKMIV